jgi:hypothetical protein
MLDTMAYECIGLQEDTLLNWLLIHGAHVTYKHVERAMDRDPNAAVVERLLKLSYHTILGLGTLSNAAKFGQTDIFELMLNAGAKIDFMIPRTLLDERESRSYAALYEAIRVKYSRD